VRVDWIDERTLRDDELNNGVPFESAGAAQRGATRSIFTHPFSDANLRMLEIAQLAQVWRSHVSIGSGSTL
jgi:hypothetical protein